MNYKNKPISDYSLQELQKIDWELAGQEEKFKIAMQHSKFEKLKPVPTMNPSFIAIREEIKKEIEVKKNAN